MSEEFYDQEKFKVNLSSLLSVMIFASLQYNYNACISYSIMYHELIK